MTCLLLTPVFIHGISNKCDLVTCDKCYHEHHDQCMGKAGMFDCDCKCEEKS